MLPKIVALCAALALASAGRDFHGTPEGAGARSGSGWEDALAADDLERVFNEVMEPGDRLLLGGGAYAGMSLRLERGGDEGRPKSIVGVDRGAGLPVFRGKWSEDLPDRGATAIRLAAGIRDVRLAGLRFEGYVFGILLPPGKDGAVASRLGFRDLGMSRLRHGFYLSDVAGVSFEDCHLRRYTKHGFRFARGCRDVVMTSCSADCSEGDAAWETKTELFPFGFVINESDPPQAGFRFRNCLAANHRMPLQRTRYKNGDGFVVEKTTTGVHFEHCRAIGNQDGGFDLKTPEVVLRDCVALGNSRGFRIWNGGTLDNCFAGGGSVGLWSNGSAVEVKRTTFHDHGSAAVMTDDRASGGVGLEDCVVAGCDRPARNTAKGSVEWSLGCITAGPVSFRAASPAWDGRSDAMDCVSHPDAGYRYRKWQPARD